VPHLSRTIKLIADGGRSSGDLSRLLSIAAEDTHNRARLERSRRQAMNSYIAIVVIGFLVYLLVILIIDASFLERIAALSSEQAQQPGDRGPPVTFTNVPIVTYQALFFHSVLIQGFGAGLLAGKLADNDALSGLKYSVGLTALSVAAFLLV
jgi:flagellar protein FlaJ